MLKNTTYNKKKILVFMLFSLAALILLCARLAYLMIAKSDHYLAKALELHERERKIKAARGEILDRNGNVIATNKTVCTVSVIYSQMTDREMVTEVLCKELGISEEIIRKKVEKISSREKIASNIDKETGDRIREYDLNGVKVDEDYKRYYPFGTLASKVMGFTGSDNQGIIGLEVKYDEVLMGTDGLILTQTDAKGVELPDVAENRKEPVAGCNLVLSLDSNIQMYASQLARRTIEAKQANYVSVIVMNPNTGEIYAMVNEPEFDLNSPYVLNYELPDVVSDKEMQDLLNQMWRNQCINDTYEPGSTFKIVTATAGLETGEITENSSFSCPGFRMVEDRRIRCHKVGGHGAEDFVQATMNSCNPVFIDVGLRVGAERFFSYMQNLGLLEKTGVDLTGEAGIIIHKIENVGPVELATMSFGQSFQITPMQLLRAACAIVNGGDLITPHFALRTEDGAGNVLHNYEYPVKRGVIDKNTSERMKGILEKVVSEGGGRKAGIEGYRIGGKTATSQKLPRGSARYISSFIGFAPAPDPDIIAICIVDEPKGIYYGGSVAAPVIKELYENILPYMGIKGE